MRYSYFKDRDKSAFYPDLYFQELKNQNPRDRIQGGKKGTKKGKLEGGEREVR
jgi:hypothetical protein